jgi:glyoxylase-like metal-dependent hydrolase (beta-lactamase superfamily II)
MRPEGPSDRSEAHAGYEAYREVLPHAGVVLAANPGPMTLQGTNTWVLSGDPSRRQAVIVDPGPDDDAHLDAILEAAGSVKTILLTHGHLDHSAGARRLHERTGAPVFALGRVCQIGEGFWATMLAWCAAV